MPTPKVTLEIIAAAIEGYEAQKSRIDERIAELRAMLRGSPSEAAATPAGSPRKRRTLSAAARARIAEAQRKRWAAAKTVSTPQAPAEAPAKPKRKLSAAGKRRIVEATKKRWAAVRAAKAAEAKVAPKGGATKKAKKRPAAKRASKPSAAQAPASAEIAAQ